MRLAGPCTLVVLLAVVVVPDAPAACPPKGLTRGELTNPFLGPEGAQWLIGPVSCLASRQETRSYLAITDEAAAHEFRQQFWSSRPVVRQIYEQRAAEADKRYREGTYETGHRTDRGMIYVNFGPPEEIVFEEFRDVSEPTVELWKYPKKADVGLDGTRPKTAYRFAKRGDLTTFYKPLPRDDVQRRLRARPAAAPPPPNRDRGGGRWKLPEQY